MPQYVCKHACHALHALPQVSSFDRNFVRLNAFSDLQVGKYRPRIKSRANRIVTDVTSAERMVMMHAKEDERTRNPQVHDKSFSKIWFLNQEAAKEATSMRKSKQRQAEVTKLLNAAQRFDASGFSALAIKEARSAVKRMSSKSSSKSHGAQFKPRAHSSLGTRSGKENGERDEGKAGGKTNGFIRVEDLSSRPNTEEGENRIKRVTKAIDSRVQLETLQDSRRPATSLGSTRAHHDRGLSKAFSPAEMGDVGSDGGGDGDPEDRGMEIGKETAAVKGGIGRMNKYIPHFRLAGRPKTAAGPQRDGWAGAGYGGVEVFPKNASERQDQTHMIPSAQEGESIYESWQRADWADAKKHFVRRSDVRSRRCMRLGYGTQVQVVDQSATETDYYRGTGHQHLDTTSKGNACSHAESCRFVPWGSQPLKSSAGFWAKSNPEEVARYSGQPADCTLFRSTGGVWVPRVHDNISSAQNITVGKAEVGKSGRFSFIGEDRNHHSMSPESREGRTKPGKGEGEGRNGKGNMILELGLDGKGKIGPHSRYKRKKVVSSEPDSVHSVLGGAVQGVGLREPRTPAQLLLENKKFHDVVPGDYDAESKTYSVPDKWRVKNNTSSIYGRRDDDIATRQLGETYAKRPFKDRQSQVAKPPKTYTDWPKYHRNNLHTTKEIEQLKDFLLPDRRVPPPVVFPRDLRKQALIDMGLEAQPSLPD